MAKLEQLLVAHKGTLCVISTKYCSSIFLFIHDIDELSGEVFDTLLSIGDFLEFKDLMLSFKASKTPVPVAAPSGPSGGSKGSKNGGGGGLDLSINGKGGLDFGITGKKIR